MDEGLTRRLTKLRANLWDAHVEAVTLMTKTSDKRIAYELEHTVMNAYAAYVCAECAMELSEGEIPAGMTYETEELERIALKYAAFRNEVPDGR